MGNCFQQTGQTRVNSPRCFNRGSACHVPKGAGSPRSATSRSSRSAQETRGEYPAVEMTTVYSLLPIEDLRMDTAWAVLQLVGAVVLVASLGWLSLRAIWDGYCGDFWLFFTGISVIYYVATQWRRARGPVFLGLAGLALIAIGATAAQRANDGSQVSFLHGNALLEQGDLDGAIAEYTTVLTLNPDVPEAYFNRGLARYQKGAFEEAIADLTRC